MPQYSLVPIAEVPGTWVPPAAGPFRLLGKIKGFEGSGLRGEAGLFNWFSAPPLPGDCDTVLSVAAKLDSPSSFPRAWESIFVTEFAAVHNTLLDGLNCAKTPAEDFVC